MIEDYRGTKIYYIERFPMYFVGDLSLAYTFIDDFLVIGINRESVKHAIDASQAISNQKSHLLVGGGFEKYSFFVTLLDGKELTRQLKDWYETNPLRLTRGLRSMFFRSGGPIEVLQGDLYRQYERKKRLGKPSEPLEYTYGGLHLWGDMDAVQVSFDERSMTSLTGSVQIEWQNLKSSGKIPEKFLTPEGISLEELLSFRSQNEYLPFVILSYLDSVFSQQRTLIPHVTLGFYVGDDAIGFRGASFVDAGTGASQSGAS